LKPKKQGIGLADAHEAQGKKAEKNVEAAPARR